MPRIRFARIHGLRSQGIRVEIESLPTTAFTPRTMRKLPFSASIKRRSPDRPDISEYSHPVPSSLTSVGSNPAKVPRRLPPGFGVPASQAAANAAPSASHAAVSPITVTLSLLSPTAFAVRCSRAHSHVQQLLDSVALVALPPEERQRLVTEGSASHDAGVIVAAYSLSAYEAVLGSLSGAPSHWRLTLVQVPRPILAAATLAPATSGRQASGRSAVLDRLPEGLRAALAPHQAEGIEFIARRRGRAMIADEMGVGKMMTSDDL